MSFRLRCACAIGWTLATFCVAGCAGRADRDTVAKHDPPAKQPSAVAADKSLPSSTDATVPVAYQETFPTRVDESVEPHVANASQFNGVLDVNQLVAEVHAQNRSLQAMVATWRAAAERYPQAIALDDPMFTSMTAPGSWNSSNVATAYIVGGSQKIPWHGKRELRGRVADAMARSAYWDFADARLELTRSAQMAFFEYYLVERQLELNTANARSLREFRDTALRQYEANLGMQQDILQADVELADLERNQVELERMLNVARARINTLMHRTPDSPLPSSPSQLTTEFEPATPDVMRSIALQRRPDLASLSAKIQAEQAALALANKEFFPDFELMGRYDSFWQPVATQGDLRAQAGVNMNVPVYLEKRRAAVREAMFKLNQQRAEYEQRIDDINNDVQTAYERVIEMRRIVQIYEDRVLPAATQNVSSARADYVAGRGDFLRLVSAQRQVISLREKHQQAIAEFHVRMADLKRAVAGPVPLNVRP